ncbi:MAG: hypothetical protein J6D34_05655 [Atopobiaceae bacterium]|nr:hypothetical protein [Atopobiaceae bacterium]
MALLDDFSEGIKTAFLAGIGAVAYGAEKSQELVDEFIRRGELTVEQGKALNEELTRKVKETTSNASDEFLRARMRTMTPEERADWIANAQKISDDLEVEDAEYEVEPEADEEPETAADEAAEEPKADEEPEA